MKNFHKSRFHKNLEKSSYDLKLVRKILFRSATLGVRIAGATLTLLRTTLVAAGENGRNPLPHSFNPKKKR